MFSFSFVAKPRGLDRVPVAARGRRCSEDEGGGRRGSGSEARRSSRRGSEASLQAGLGGGGGMPSNLNMSTVLALKMRSKKWTRSE